MNIQLLYVAQGGAGTPQYIAPLPCIAVQALFYMSPIDSIVIVLL